MINRDLVFLHYKHMVLYQLCVGFLYPMYMIYILSSIKIIPLNCCPALRVLTVSFTTVLFYVLSVPIFMSGSYKEIHSFHQGSCLMNNFTPPLITRFHQTNGHLLTHPKHHKHAKEKIQPKINKQVQIHKKKVQMHYKSSFRGGDQGCCAAAMQVQSQFLEMYCIAIKDHM